MGSHFSLSVWGKFNTKATPIYFLVSRIFFFQKTMDQTTEKKIKKRKIVLANKKIYNTLLTKEILQNNIWRLILTLF